MNVDKGVDWYLQMSNDSFMYCQNKNCHAFMFKDIDEFIIKEEKDGKVIANIKWLGFDRDIKLLLSQFKHISSAKTIHNLEYKKKGV